MKPLFLATLSILALCAVGQALAQDKKDFRRVDVPTEEHGYNGFKSQVIDSEQKLNAFIKQVEGESGWNNRASFLKALADAKIDFTNETLVLIRQAEGSGSNRVSFAPPELKGDKLVCVIHREVSQIGTADMAYYCFAVAVIKGKAKEAEVWVNTKGTPKADKPVAVLSLTAQ